MKNEDWEIYRRLEMYEIQNECLKELDSEMEEEKNENVIYVSAKTLYLIYISFFIFTGILFYLFFFHLKILYELMESPFAKAFILSSPGIYGYFLNRKQKKRDRKLLEKLEAKYKNV